LTWEITLQKKIVILEPHEDSIVDSFVNSKCGSNVITFKFYSTRNSCYNFPNL